ncbi:hypothetical protein TELCIR_25001 [Teladorsagia circumcincta]|uniref:Uncharacterized protein n=1 Tax=Teladorsagia circumcincta TaxID=45464 RepID=A0A2G9T6T7_TELCI|nr:hypothetical protein TELCIR_25001 [Teladorsagia circumcincta]
MSTLTAKFLRRLQARLLVVFGAELLEEDWIWTIMRSGGIYFLVSHVLGGRLGGAVGLIYALGQVNKFYNVFDFADN